MWAVSLGIRKTFKASCQLCLPKNLRLCSRTQGTLICCCSELTLEGIICKIVFTCFSANWKLLLPLNMDNFFILFFILNKSGEIVAGKHYQTFYRVREIFLLFNYVIFFSEFNFHLKSKKEYLLWYCLHCLSPWKMTLLKTNFKIDFSKIRINLAYNSVLKQWN